MLHRPERHEALNAAPWSEAYARRTIQQIVDGACERFDAESLWPVHPGDAADEGRDGPQFPLYSGAAGVIWALGHLRSRGAAQVPESFDRMFDDTIGSLLDRSHALIAPGDTERASFFLRDAGILLAQYKRLGGDQRADALHRVIEGNLRNPALEALWGSPGTLVAAIHMIEATGEARWIELLRRGVDILWSQMHEVTHSSAPQRRVWIWTQDLYGRIVRYMGAGHGFAGNVYPVLRGARWLDPAVVRGFEERAFEALEVAAVREGDGVNWEPMFDPKGEGMNSRFLMQDCHGAPGIVNRLAGTTHEPLRALLVGGGEAIWEAGPLCKPPGLCHGTDGNGYAFLKLHAMTGEARWQERARAFAMHACTQSEFQMSAIGHRRFSLWTGDLGLAIYLQACIDDDASLPALDVF